jgi:hypothetical protein
LHETAATQWAYRKEAELLILWSVIEREGALSSLTTKDAIDQPESFHKRNLPEVLMQVVYEFCYK